jgi:hypothetical protein
MNLRQLEEASSPASLVLVYQLLCFRRETEFQDLDQLHGVVSTAEFAGAIEGLLLMVLCVFDHLPVLAFSDVWQF